MSSLITPLKLINPAVMATWFRQIARPWLIQNTLRFTKGVVKNYQRRCWKCLTSWSKLSSVYNHNIIFKVIVKYMSCFKIKYTMTVFGSIRIPWRGYNFYSLFWATFVDFHQRARSPEGTLWSGSALSTIFIHYEPLARRTTCSLPNISSASIFKVILC